MTIKQSTSVETHFNPFDQTWIHPESYNVAYRYDSIVYVYRFANIYIHASNIVYTCHKFYQLWYMIDFQLNKNYNQNYQHIY